MTGRRRSSFRSGDLAEHLGLLLLKGVAAVADVPRQEDVGLDAVASLLRRDKDGNCYAEDTFIVQLKSESKKVIEYQNHELSWFLGQSQPMFIGRVSLKNSRIALYPTVVVNQAVLALHAKRVAIQFGPSNIPGFYGMSSWAGGSDDSATVWLGNPLLEWNLADIVEKAWLHSTYEMLKRFLELARREYELLSFGICSYLEWSTNDKDSIRPSFLMGKGHADKLPSVVERCMPGLQALFMLASEMPEKGRNPLLASLICLVSALRQLGANIDTDNLFVNLGVALLAESMSSKPDNPRTD